MRKRLLAFLAAAMVMVSSMSVFAYPNVDYDALPDIEGYVKANVKDNEIGSLYTEIDDSDPVGCAVVEIDGQKMLIYHGILIPFLCPSEQELAQMKAEYKSVKPTATDYNYVANDDFEIEEHDESEDIQYYKQLFAQYNASKAN